MRVTLAGSAIVLPSVGEESARYNLALGCLQAYAESRLDGVEIRRAEFPISLDQPSLPPGTAEAILAGDPEVVGISSYCWDLDAFEQVLRDVRRLSPSARIVLGGPSATFSAREIMERSRLIDVAAMGEGEETLVDLVRRRLTGLAEVPGVIYRDGEALRECPPRRPIDLATLPSPYVAGLLRPPRKNLMIECSRGCVFRCKYCAWKNFLGGMRYAPGETLRAEMAWARAHDYEHVFVLDSAINFDDGRLRAITDALKGVGAGRPRFSYFISHGHFGDAQRRCLDGLPTHEIYVGLESVSPRALRTIGRKAIDRAAFERVLGDLGRVGSVVVSIILGIPGDTLAGFKETVSYLIDIAEGPAGRRIASVRVFWMIVPPGTYFARNKEALGIRVAARGAPYLLGCESFPEHDLAGAFRFLGAHPRRSLFVYDDASPARHLSGLDDLPRLGDGGGAGARGAGGVTLRAVRMLLPCVFDPRAAPGGWRVEEVTAGDGRAAIRFRRDAREVTVELRARAGGAVEPILAPSPPAAGDADGSAVELVRFLAEEMRKGE